ncbi:RNA-directed DNA polymerase from mobile element jockey [Plakobranchus ocellatus]|uniref:RNA-directed DNA polymerase from mobile element jockey n=1 Tax=Plakobranchus ocellatus TaxID=259542 RepID=A0AAV4C0I1_9GAST|nr:RNA-directed DNA polymerase from mobile element jockey [Plakobranchus ocellatus]
MLVPLRLNFEQSQQRSPRMAAKVPLLLRQRGKKSRRILRLPVPREQQKPKYQPSAGPKIRKDRRPQGKHSIVLRLRPWKLRGLLSSIWGDSSTPSSPRACESPTGEAEPIVLNTGLHATAATVNLEKTLTVCSLYLPPNTPVSKVFLVELFEQLPKPFLLLGDFNAHSPAWGDSRRDGRGRMLEEFMAENDLIIRNCGEQTFVHSAYHSTSAIDLAVASFSIAAECSWAAQSDLSGSDHFPIFLTLSSNFNSNCPPPWEEHQVHVDISVTKQKKEDTSEFAYQKEFSRIRERCSNRYAVFTAGSKLEEKVAAAAYFSEHPDCSKETRLRDGVSVFSAELEGIAHGLTEIKKKKLTKYHKIVLSTVTAYQLYRLSKAKISKSKISGACTI